MERDVAQRMLTKHPEYADVLWPYLTADELIGEKDSLPKRYVIDFGSRDLLEAQHYTELFEIVERTVLSSREDRAARERERNAEAESQAQGSHTPNDHAQALTRWWQLFRRRGEMLDEIGSLNRYAVCGQVTKRPIFAFLSPKIHPNAALIVFPFEDDYSFGILQSDAHWQWFIARCSTLKGDFRYTSNTVFDSFPWPQNPTTSQVRAVAGAAVGLRQMRSDLRRKHGLSLRELYRALEKPGKHALAEAHEKLNDAVRTAYGMGSSADILDFLLQLNHACAGDEAAGRPIQGPGVPASFKGKARDLVTQDCISMPGLRLLGDSR